MNGIALSLNMPGDILDMVYTLCMLHVIVHCTVHSWWYILMLCHSVHVLHVFRKFLENILIGFLADNLYSSSYTVKL